MKFAMYAGFSKEVLECGIEEAAKHAQSLGFSAVEFLADGFCMENTPFLEVEEAKKAAKILKKYGLSVACYSVCCDLWSDPSIENFMMKQVEVAAAVGSPYFHHTLIPWLEFPENAPVFDEVIDHVVSAAKKIADHANRYGITCLYEDQGIYVNGVKNFGSFWKKIKKLCSNVGICGDLGNILFVNEQPQKFLCEYAQDIKHIHVKDYLRKKAMICPGNYWIKAREGEWLRDTIIGDGVINLEECMKILKNIGYEGYFSLENTHPEPYEEGVKQAMHLLEEIVKRGIEDELCM